MYCIDLETHLIKAGCPAPKLVCMTVYDGEGEGEIFLHDEALELARKLLETEHIVGHHIFFDLGVLAAEDSSLIPLIFKAIKEGRIHCTKIRQMIIDNAEGKLKFVWDEENNKYKTSSFSLQALVFRHFGRQISKGEDTWRMRYNELDGIPLSDWPPEALLYAIEDAILCWRVWDVQEQHCQPHGLPGGPMGEARQIQAAWALYLMSMWGVRTDETMVENLKEKISEEWDEFVKEAQEHKFIRKGIKQSKNLANIREAIQTWCLANKKLIETTDKGFIATTREQLTSVECAKCGFTFDKCDCGANGIAQGLWAVAETGRLGKLLTTYVPALERATKVPLNPNYNPIIETFRTSCSQGMKIETLVNGVIKKIPVGSNVQNPPRKGGVRECYVPREGSVFAFSDYDTLEMRAFGQVCHEFFGYSYVIEAIKEGRDLHVDFAADMLEIHYDEVFLRHEQGDPEIEQVRQGCKISNYGMLGGMGADTFISYAKGYGQVVSLSLANKLHKGLRSKWKETVPYFRMCAQLVDRETGRAKLIEFPKSKLMRGNVTYTATCNGFFQHRAAMGAKEALGRVAPECYMDMGTPLYGCRPWLFAHDEIGIEIPYSGKRASDAAIRLQEVMIEAMVWWCPDVPIGASVAMTRRWWKGAKPLFENGILVPVKPEGKKWVRDDDWI